MSGVLPEFQNTLARKGPGILYSTALTGTAALALTTIDLFGYGLGQIGFGFTAASTLAQTNYRSQGRQMPAQMSFMVHGIALAYSYCATSGTSSRNPVSSTDLHNLTDNGVLLQWVMNDGTPIEVAGTAMIGSGGGVGAYGVAGTAGAVNSELGIGRGLWRLAQPFPLYPLASWLLQLSFGYSAGAQTANTAIRCTLVGEYGFTVPQG